MSGKELSFLSSREELRKIPTPLGNRRWQPVPYHSLVECVTEALESHNFKVHSETYTLQRAGSFFFGILDLSEKDPREAYYPIVGLRSSTNRRLSAQISVGVRIGNTQTLAFSADTIALKKKHTTGLMLQQEVSTALQVYQFKYHQFLREIGEYKKIKLKDIEAKEILVDCFIDEILPLRLMKAVYKHYFEPSYSETHPRTLWSLHTAFTLGTEYMAGDNKFLTLQALAKAFKLRTQIPIPPLEVQEAGKS